MKVIFVDDEANVLQGLKRSLRALRNECDIQFLSSGKEVLELLSGSDEPYDLIVSDMRMPGMDGAELLTAVKIRYPYMFRFALSGGTEQDVVFKTTTLAHQFLSKPCDAETLKNAVLGTKNLIKLIESGPLRKLLSLINSIPSLPAAYERLLRELNKEEPSIKRIGEIISSDLGMMTKILQLVNSAFFGVAHNISQPDQAATMLGLETIKALALSIKIFSLFEPELFPEFNFNQLFSHAIKVGKLAKAIMLDSGADAKTGEEAMLAGMLHDTGKLVLATNLPVRYRKAFSLLKTDNKELFQAEREVLGADHAQCGAYVLGLWGLPASVIEAIACHHEPQQAREDKLNMPYSVHIANVLINRLSPDSKSGDSDILDMEHIDILGLNDKLKAWETQASKIYREEER